MAYSIEMQLKTTNPEFVRKFGRRVKAVGGRYSSCRGYHYTRFVHIPVNTTFASGYKGLKLAQEILDYAKAPTVLLFREDTRMAAVRYDNIQVTGPRIHFTTNILKNKDSGAKVTVADVVAKYEEYFSSPTYQDALQRVQAARQAAEREEALAPLRMTVRILQKLSEVNTEPWVRVALDAAKASLEKATGWEPWADPNVERVQI